MFKGFSGSNFKEMTGGFRSMGSSFKNAQGAFGKAGTLFEGGFADNLARTLTGKDSAGWNNMFSNMEDRKSTRLNSSHVAISYAVFCLKKKQEKARQKHNKRKNN